MADVGVTVTLEVKSVDIEARCDCGDPIAVHHHVLSEGTLDTAALADFFTEAHRLHMSVADDGKQSHTMSVRLANLEARTHIP